MEPEASKTKVSETELKACPKTAQREEALEERTVSERGVLTGAKARRSGA